MTRIKIVPRTAGFAEDKDDARAIRLKKILPALDEGHKIILDFKNVQYATQSYVHALVGEAIKKHGEPVLESISFMNCSPQLKSVIELVVDYSLSGFPQQPMVANGPSAGATARRRTPKKGR